MTSAPAISVVIPTYNRRRLVGEAIASVRAQTFQDFELIVVDDGSTDDTEVAVREACEGDPRLRYILKKNGGTASARNRGIDEARAELLAFLDSDDLWHPRYLESQKETLEAHNADMVMCDVDYLGHIDRKSDHMFADPDFKPPTSPAGMCHGGWGLPSAEMVRTDIAKRLKFRSDYHYSEDTEFLFRFQDRGHTCVLNKERLAVWRNHDGGDGAAQKTDRRAEFEREALRMLDEYRHMAPDWRRMNKRVYFKHRQLAKALVREGNYRDARPHLRAWIRRRPLRARPIYWYLRSFFGGGAA